MQAIRSTSRSAARGQRSSPPSGLAPAATRWRSTRSTWRWRSRAGSALAGRLPCDSMVEPAARESAVLRDETEQLPRAAESLELVRSGILQDEVRTFEQVLRRRRDQDLVRTGQSEHARGGVNGDASNIATDELDFARVQADSNRQLHRPRGRDHRPGAADRTRGAIEDRKEAIARRLHLAPPEHVELLTQTGIVSDQEGMPGGVANPLKGDRRRDDVREHDRGQGSIATFVEGGVEGPRA